MLYTTYLLLDVAKAQKTNNRLYYSSVIIINPLTKISLNSCISCLQSYTTILCKISSKVHYINHRYSKRRGYLTILLTARLIVDGQRSLYFLNKKWKWIDAFLDWLVNTGLQINSRVCTGLVELSCFKFISTDYHRPIQLFLYQPHWIMKFKCYIPMSECQVFDTGRVQVIQFTNLNHCPSYR